MIIRVFKISTEELWKIPNKKQFIEFIKQETGHIVPSSFTIKQLITYLPVEDYCIIK